MTPTVNEVAERFLDEELHNSGYRIDPVDRARFHRLVRLCVENWVRHPRASLRMNRGKNGVSLLFEGPMGGRTFGVFTLRVDYRKGEYRFIGPNPDRERMGLSPGALETLDRLRDLYAALLSDTSSVETAVSVRLQGKPFPDLVPLVEESRRVLDGGADGTHTGPPPKRTPRRSGAAQTAPPEQKGQKMSPGSPERKTSGGKAAPGKQQPPGGLKPTARVSAVVLTCPEPKESAAFYRRIFGVKSGTRTGPMDHAVYEMGGTTVILRQDLTSEERRRAKYGTVSRNRGWGFILRILVDDFEACLKRAKRVPDALLHADADEGFMQVQDPGGYLLEVAAS